MGLLSDYIAKKMSVVELENELMSLISAYNKKTNSFLMVYAGALSKSIPGVSMGMEDYYTIFDILKKNTSTKLNFYIETPGGSGEACEEIVRFLRNKYTEISYIIAGEAKSAGTIMALSGDEILMTDSGSLGPIDAQVQIGRCVQSAYDYMDWVNKKRKQAKNNNKLNPFDATMVAQISPGELNGVYNSLNFAKDLVVDWLPKYKFKNWNITDTKKRKVTPKMKKERARKIVAQLINHKKWRSHARSFKIQDLENIGLKIKRIDDDIDISDLVYKIQMVIKLLFNSSTVYKIFAIENEKIFWHAAQVNNPPQISPKQAEVVEIEVVCPQCKTKHKIYAKLVDNPKIDNDFKARGYNRFPIDNKFKCSCGMEIDLTGFRNDIESQTGKKIL